MLIKYIHSSEPKKVKIHDTVKAYQNMMFAILDPSTKLYGMTQEDFDKFYIENFEKDKQKGVIKQYEIISE